MNKKGQDIEREVRKQAQERARRQGGPSTAALEADLWFEVLQHCEDLSVAAVVREFGPLIELLTGIVSYSKQRQIVSAALANKGNRLFLGSWGGFSDEAERGAAQALAEAQDEYAAEIDRGQFAASTGGIAKARGSETHLRDVIVRDAATSESASQRLEQANTALSDAGFPSISARTLRRILH